MRIAKSSATTNPSSNLGKPHLGIPLGVMGILLVMVVPMQTLTMDLLISLDIALSIVLMLVSYTSCNRCLSQYSHHSSFSLPPKTRNDI